MNKENFIEGSIFILVIMGLISLFYFTYTSLDSSYKINKELSNINYQKFALQKKIILSKKIDECDKFYLLSLSSWNIDEKNYWLNMQTNCLLSNKTGEGKSKFE